MGRKSPGLRKLCVNRSTQARNAIPLLLESIGVVRIQELGHDLAEIHARIVKATVHHLVIIISIHGHEHVTGVTRKRATTESDLLERVARVLPIQRAVGRFVTGPGGGGGGGRARARNGQ